MAEVRSLRREPVAQGIQELPRLQDPSTHPHQTLWGPVRLIDATLTSPQPTLLHRGDQRLQLGDFA